ncbi:MAG: hypothetical protein LUO95_10670 [Methylococcaceae bacterium]|nr:hypothetical protein [Methylococcaceae bacterium]MDD1611023.1 hypothetical protein [Methylococcaceae bacterium]MDD1615639.1 hypothetical protein [Methylococcaceae bacterium]OYV19797.1 MAG: hypothetical protein CG439_732 [Methylococcaceae bacterium NSP1-2]
MKKLAIVLLVLSCTALVACSKGQEINGHNTKTAYRSVKGLKRYMKPETQLEFEVSFWMLRDANKDDTTFLDIVDGKKPQEIIELGKVLYQERKAAGFKAYEQYPTWEAMITKFGKERIDQDKVSKSKDSRDSKENPDNSVIYDPSSPKR